MRLFPTLDEPLLGRLELPVALSHSCLRAGEPSAEPFDLGVAVALSFDQAIFGCLEQPAALSELAAETSDLGFALASVPLELGDARVVLVPARLEPLLRRFGCGQLKAPLFASLARALR